MTIIAICTNPDCIVKYDSRANVGAGLTFGSYQKAVEFISLRRSAPCVGCGARVELNIES